MIRSNETQTDERSKARLIAYADRKLMAELCGQALENQGDNLNPKLTQMMIKMFIHTPSFLFNTHRTKCPLVKSDLCCLEI